MAPDATRKRLLPPKVSKMKARKRIKLDTPISAPIPAPRSTQPGGFSRLDELEWKEVVLPDRLDDYEGFYGLEELSDIEVVKDESGKTSYKKTSQVGSTGCIGGTQAGVKAGGSAITGSIDESASQEENQDGEDEEWSGISDEEEASDEVSNGHEAANGRSLATTAEKPQEFGDLNNKRTKNKSFNAFSALAEEELSKDGIDLSAWEQLDLAPETMASLAGLRFSTPTLIQSLAIPEIMAGHDVIGKASTGSGKTLAFGIPMLEHFLSSRRNQSKQKSRKGPRAPPVALVLSPTRELAHQLHKHLTLLCSTGPTSGPSVVAVTGGLSLLKQQRLLETADIVIATPGRLWEVMSSGHGLLAWLQETKFLVLDEADRLLSEGHFKEVEEIINSLDRKVVDEDQDGLENVTENPLMEERQTLVFSATFQKELQQKLSRKTRQSDLLNKTESLEYLIGKLNFREDTPKFIDANPVSQMAERLEEGIIECPGTEKVCT